MERTAIFPGSFDPFTRGHAALVDEALNLFDRVVIGIGNNTAKQGLLTVGNRKRLIDDIYAGNPRVEARVYTGLTGEFAEQVGACAIIRGVRNTTDFEYERTMEATNHRIYPEITTVMLFTPSPVADISSSTVREVLSFGRTVEEFMPEGIDINKYLTNRSRYDGIHSRNDRRISGRRNRRRQRRAKCTPSPRSRRGRPAR